MTTHPQQSLFKCLGFALTATGTGQLKNDIADLTFKGLLTKERLPEVSVGLGRRFKSSRIFDQAQGFAVFVRNKTFRLILCIERTQ